MINLKELVYAEALLDSINSGQYHPANDKRHPSHAQNRNAVNRLEAMVSKARHTIETGRKVNHQFTQLFL